MSIFSLYSIKQKQKKFADFIIFFLAFSKFYKNEKLLPQIFKILIIHQPSPVSREVLTFIGYKQTNRHPRKAKFIYTRLLGRPSLYKFSLSVCLFVSNKRQNGWTDRAQILCGTSRDPGKGNDQNLTNFVFKIFYFWKFWKCAKKYNEIRKLFLLLFYTAQREDAQV